MYQFEITSTMVICYTSRFSLQFCNKLKDNSETAQTTPKQNTNGCTAESGEADRLNILPRNEVLEKIWCNSTGSKTKQAAQNKTCHSPDCHDDECLFNCHSAKRFLAKKPEPQLL